MATTPSLVELGRQLMDEARDLIRKEIELAKVEVIALLKTNALAVGLFAGAAVVALVFLSMLQVAIILTLPFSAQWIVAWCLAAFWLIVIIVLALLGKSKLKFKPPEKTISTIKGDIEWAKGQIHSNAKS
ncbi:MAG: phage holin family protein [Chloroflexota bacterium]